MEIRVTNLKMKQYIVNAVGNFTNAAGTLGKAFLLASALLLPLTVTSCGSDNGSGSDSDELPTPTPTPTPEQPPTNEDTYTFAKGADVSWLSEMEADGVKFYDASGKSQECMTLLRSLGVNSIRLRVWVNPVGGWCAKDDVVAKASRAQKLGMRIMLDFHYSDTWADPGSQKVPEAWLSYTYDEMKQAVANHTKEVLSAVKAQGVSVEWVQVGNETPDGMLYMDANGNKVGSSISGCVSDGHADHFAGYVNAGYEAVKGVYPDAKVIVHIDAGDKLSRSTWIFDKLKAAGGKWDVIGLSFYPEESTWQTQSAQCLANIKTLASKYSCDVAITEIGMSWDSSNAAAMMQKMVSGCKDISTCEGVFYWEPEVYNNWKPAIYTQLGWNAYTKGAFDKSGKPTAVFNAFAN